MNPEINRRKAAMVLHELEMSLGNYVIARESSLDNVSESLLEQVVKRELSRNRSINSESIRDIVEATYLDEIFQIALDVTRDTSSYVYLQKLKEQFVLHDVYEIRNVLSHPNRKFIDTYWYRIASIASDPILDVLGLDDVKKTLIAAENDQITEPPEEWYQQALWTVPNNIPDNFEHAITGLVGRRAEAEKLLDTLRNPRINTVAIVAPGGLGKTALALDLISQNMAFPETKDWCDLCIFVSMKTERLTSEGLMKLDAVETMEEVKEKISKEAQEVFSEKLTGFEEFKDKFKQEKVLLFIDNLETLLVESPQDFDEFNVSLPPAWRVLVTSRIAIPNASIVALEPLKEKSAIHMARAYFSRRGGVNGRGDVFKSVASNCFGNPLAIRLSVDLYLSGSEVPTSIEVANKEIASFSYNNLVENITENSVKILEALFVEDVSSRLGLCDLLNINRDELAVGISELTNTSLIVRKIQDNDEVFMLSSSVRELLLTSPRNISVRNEIQEQINRRKILALEIDAKQMRNNIPSHHLDYIPSDTNENLKILLTELNAAASGKFSIKNDRAVLLYRKFKEASYLYHDNYLFHRGYARILFSLNALQDAVRHFNKAIELNEFDPGSKILLAMLYHKSSDFDKAERLYTGLMEDGWGEVKDGDTKTAYMVVHGYYLALLFGHKYEVVLEKTKNWKEVENFRGIVGAFRASAWKRKSENIVNTDFKTTISCLTSAIRILDDVFRNDGYIKGACVQAKNIFNELAYCLARKEYRNNDAFSQEGLEFINKHLHNTVEYARFNEDDFAYKLIERLSNIDVSNNPFRGKRLELERPAKLNGIDDDEIERNSLLRTSITRIPKGRNGGRNTFLFASDEKGVDYFIHYDQLSNGGWAEWRSLSKGDELAIKPNTNYSKGKSASVLEAYLVSGH